MKQLLLLADYKNGETGSERLGNLPIITQAEGAGSRITLCPNSILYTRLTLHLGEGAGEDSPWPRWSSAMEKDFKQVLLS